MKYIEEIKRKRIVILIEIFVGILRAKYILLNSYISIYFWNWYILIWSIQSSVKTKTRSMSYWDSYLDEVDTENDWPEEAKSIADIERLLRCPICKGIIDGAVILSTCGHSCCSLCLNRFLATQSRCPICRTPCTESNIVRNLLLEEVCHQFSVTRSSLLLLANTISEKISQKRLIYATEMELRRKKKEEQQQVCKLLIGWFVSVDG